MSKVLVLDDDPTGSQTAHDVPVFTVWDLDEIVDAFRRGEKAVFYITNSRALSIPEARKRGLSLGAQIKRLAESLGEIPTIISRSDSTLRGHFPTETDALMEGLGVPIDGVVLCPFFGPGGRITFRDLHYVETIKPDGVKIAVPVGETEFAKDRTFGFTSSNLREFVKEKAIQPDDEIVSVYGDIPADKARLALELQKQNPVYVCSASNDHELSRLVQLFKQQEKLGKRFLYRTAASWVTEYAQIPRRAYLTKAEICPEPSVGLWVVGSYVAKSTEQLENWVESTGIEPIWLDVAKLEEDHVAQTEKIRRQIETDLANKKTVMLATSRQRTHAGRLDFGAKVSRALCRILKDLEVRPDYVVAKGGITSYDLAIEGMGVSCARVMGQVQAGVSVWQLGSESKWPGLPYIVFPGNVGGERALVDLFELLA